MLTYLDSTGGVDLDSVDGTRVGQWLNVVALEWRSLGDRGVSWRANSDACKQGSRTEGGLNNEVVGLHDEGRGSNSFKFEKL